MSHGGKRDGAGRPEGAGNKDHRYLMRQFGIEETWLSPLEFCLAVMNNQFELLEIKDQKGLDVKSIPVQTRLEAARIASPYMHQKLPTIVEQTVNHSWAEQVQRAEQRAYDLRKQTVVDEDGRSILPH